tara:strand:+ start:495 stop:1100 length:606 start_codon:yes stop_codon:yes gene_type:complete
MVKLLTDNELSKLLWDRRLQDLEKLLSEQKFDEALKQYREQIFDENQLKIMIEDFVTPKNFIWVKGYSPETINNYIEQINKNNVRYFLWKRIVRRVLDTRNEMNGIWKKIQDEKDYKDFVERFREEDPRGLIEGFQVNKSLLKTETKIETREKMKYIAVAFLVTLSVVILYRYKYLLTHKRVSQNSRRNFRQRERKCNSAR